MAPGVLATLLGVPAVAGGVAGAWLARRCWRRLPAARRRVQQLRRLLDTADGPGANAVQRAIDRSLWPQIESLLTLYRVLDGADTLPPTRRWAASPDFLLHLVRHIQRATPKIIVECGGGTSTVAMAYALRLTGGGHLYTLENHAGQADRIWGELQRRGLTPFVTMLMCPLVERTFAGFDTVFHWYDVDPASIPDGVDMLVVDGPPGIVNQYARYPAGPILLPKLAAHGHVFIDDADRADEGKLPVQWRALYPDLGVRVLDSEKGALEMFFLDHVIKEFLDPGDAS